MYSTIHFKSPVFLGKGLTGGRTYAKFPSDGELEMTDFGITIRTKDGARIDVFKENISCALHAPSAPSNPEEGIVPPPRRGPGRPRKNPEEAA